MPPGPIRLLTPPHHATTEPLQKHYWQTDAEAAAADRRGPAAPASFDWTTPQIFGADRSQPNAVSFSWLPPAGVRERLRYDLLLSTSPELTTPLAVPDLPAPAIRVRHLWIDTVYYWRVIAKVGGVPVSESPVWAFRTHPATPRWIRVPDATNVRDLGGWRTGENQRVRQGRLYRSSELNGHIRLTPEGETILLHDLRVRTDLDLRGSDEMPQPALPESWVRWINAPIQPYALIAEPFSRDALRRIFEILADEDSYPLLFHCWAGADRAGTLAFLINALLGVAFEDLVRDYELSSLSVWGERSRNAPEFRALLETLERFGDNAASIQKKVENFLLQVGIETDCMRRIRALLIENTARPDWGPFMESF